jgi:hypothetical protein
MNAGTYSRHNIGVFLLVTNQNVNNNTNNIHLNLKVEQAKAPRKTAPPKKAKPNWVVRAIVIGIIGLTLSLIGFYIKKTKDHKPHSIENGAQPILRDK